MAKDDDVSRADGRPVVQQEHWISAKVSVHALLILHGHSD